MFLIGRVYVHIYLIQWGQLFCPSTLWHRMIHAMEAGKEVGRKRRNINWVPAVFCVLFYMILFICFNNLYSNFQRQILASQTTQNCKKPGCLISLPKVTRLTGRPGYVWRQVHLNPMQKRTLFIVCRCRLYLSSVCMLSTLLPYS